MIVSIIVTMLVLALGVWRRNQPGFWPRGIAAVVIAWALPFLFSGGGTLERPEGDGLITHLVRRATDDGPLMALWAIFVLVAGYGSIIWLIVSAVLKSRPKTIEVGG
jgi:hypothetical protein